jgi:D-alanyl-lipoteichoic acid acyltransferase DltB (MBOAT superfamily)
MAIGIALILGFKFPMNFDSPYKSLTISEFWNRWHISLSSWLKDYLYISLGGNRHGKLRQYLNLIITMLLGGLWHGASLNFVAWGAFHGIALAVDKIKNSLLHRPKNYRPTGVHKIISIIITFNFVCFCWIFFRNSTFEGSWTMINQIFTNFQPQIFSQWITSYWSVASLMILGYLIHFSPKQWANSVKELIIKTPLALQSFIIVIIIFIVMQIKSSDVQPFIYFQF